MRSGEQAARRAGGLRRRRYERKRSDLWSEAKRNLGTVRVLRRGLEGSLRSGFMSSAKRKQTREYTDPASNTVDPAQAGLNPTHLNKFY